MKYQSIYDSLIERARYRALDCYTESHHIIPRCMGGSDDKSNLVDLTPEEHYVAHQLLVKIHPFHHGLAKAALCMSMNSGGRQNNKLYGWLRRRASYTQSGEGNPFYGKKHSEETKKLIGHLHKGKILSEETRSKISESRLNNPISLSKEQKRKISDRNSGKGNGMYGKKHSDESISKMKKSRPNQSGSSNPSAKSVTVNGVNYPCMKDACSDLNISMHKLRKLL